MEHPKRKPTRYRIEASREGVDLTVDEDFWNETIVDDTGTTQLDFNIASVIQEIRAALYLVAAQDRTKH